MPDNSPKDRPMDIDWTANGKAINPKTKHENGIENLL